MAIKRMTFTCDNDRCYKSEYEEEFLTEDEATESGWCVLRGPERELGGNGERIYCSASCMQEDLF